MSLPLGTLQTFTFCLIIMLDFQQKRKVRSVIYHKATLVVLFLIVLLLARSTWLVWGKKQESEEMRRVSSQNVEELRARNDNLQSKIGKLDTNSGVEQEIRAKYSVVKEGENMVVVVEDPDSKSATTTQEMGFWKKIWHFLSP